MRKTKQMPLVTASIALAALGISCTAPRDPARQSTSAAGADRTELTSALRSLRDETSAVAGWAEFDCIMESDSEIITQTCKLYVDSSSVRLDVLFANASKPVIAARHGQDAWMVWTDNAVLYRSAWPFTLKPGESGWRGQMFNQVRQAEAWCGMLLLADVAAAEVQSAVRDGDELKADLIYRGAAVQGVFKRQLGKLRPVELVLGSGNRFTFEDYQTAPGKLVLPTRIRFREVTRDGGAVVTTWRVRRWETGVAESVFRSPNPTFNEHSLVGECQFAPNGEERVITWPAAPRAERES